MNNYKIHATHTLESIFEFDVIADTAEIARENASKFLYELSWRHANLKKHCANNHVEEGTLFHDLNDIIYEIEICNDNNV